MKIIKTTYHKVTEIKPQEFQDFMISTVGEKSMDNLYNCLKNLAHSYPGFEKWFNDTVIPEIKKKSGEREIIITLSEIETNGNIKMELSGIAILKNTASEKKICTFRIHENYRKQGIGKDLFEACLEYLGTSTPIITISENRITMFEPLLEQYSFVRTQELKDYYKEGSTEYVYNGCLS